MAKKCPKCGQKIKPPRKKGRGKAKGADYERTICKQLSRWLSNGKREDLLWRSAMSGGRATVGLKQGKKHGASAGDISAIDPLGKERLTRYFTVECKHLHDMCLDRFCVEHRGPLRPIWEEINSVASKFNRMPMLIARQDRFETLCFVDQAGYLALYSITKGAVRRARRGNIHLKDGTVMILSFEKLMSTRYERTPHDSR